MLELRPPLSILSISESGAGESKTASSPLVYYRRKIQKDVDPYAHGGGCAHTDDASYKTCAIRVLLQQAIRFASLRASKCVGIGHR